MSSEEKALREKIYDLCDDLTNVRPGLNDKDEDEIYSLLDVAKNLYKWETSVVFTRQESLSLVWKHAARVSARLLTKKGYMRQKKLLAKIIGYCNRLDDWWFDNQWETDKLP